ncbi:GntR family transcriptional regulator [Pseudomonas sp. CC120222-01a]|uniref:GntR family transcriptional regulator n=1 Tax=Pseudomonas sp. CC120222-01a TaxID=1378075 RepID=UPI000D9E834A|nr:GntR family transcriptional regulator [Pseudomonas sp. CC120222-01a]PVZ42534.1 DNA-binding GntR family transcriptional regulator [Pseudomonas sp. CC120222-01a]
MKSEAREVAHDDRKAYFIDELCRRVLSMNLAPGAALDELKLVKEYGLSRPPIREALRKIAAEGYIVLEANRAPRVTHLCHDAARSFFHAAPMVYDATMQLAAKNATREAVNVLREIQSRYRENLQGDPDELLYLVNSLYIEMGKIANNSFLLPSLRRLLIDHARLEKTWHLRSTPDDSQRMRRITCMLHDQIVDAIEEHNPKRVSHLVQRWMKVARRTGYNATIRIRRTSAVSLG